MGEATVYAKTGAGRDEIETRARKLSPVLRSLLLVVDGRRDGGALSRLAAGLHAPHDAMEQLLAQGLIEPAGAGAVQVIEDAPAVAQRYRLLSGLMSEAARQHLGLRGYLMQLRIERCASVEDLQALLPDLQAAVAKAKGSVLARQWSEAVQAAAS